MTVEALAKQLHRDFRAASKALSLNWSMTNVHDHGWKGCHQQTYFLKRARRLLKEGTYAKGVL